MPRHTKGTATTAIGNAVHGLPRAIHLAFRHASPRPRLGRPGLLSFMANGATMTALTSSVNLSMIRFPLRGKDRSKGCKARFGSLNS